MDLRVRWLEPFYLIDGAHDRLIYDIEDFDEIPESAGVYVFARAYGKTVSPLYIGRAENLSKRIEQQLNNVRLMNGIRGSQAGYRTVYIGEFISKGGQNAGTALRIIESALISTALVDGFNLLNVQGTKTLAHAIASSGNREARSWLPDNTIKLRRAEL